MKLLRTAFSNFINNKKDYPYLIAFAAGLYPFIHYYNRNLSIADSWQQLLFVSMLCFAIPQLLVVLRVLIFSVNSFKVLKPFWLSLINCVCFLSLLGFLVFHFSIKQFAVLLFGAVIIGFLVSKHIKKIIVLQLLVAAISFVGLVPKLWFSVSFSNDKWSSISAKELNTVFDKAPNIFVIQPDGYVNFSEIYKTPYDFDNSEFEAWLSNNRFTNYANFRSNYYSTLTSNASLFAMKHHYYSNTNPNTLNTHKANEVIIGQDNNAIKILKSNNYKTHLITDNSYFLLNRTPLFYDFSNITNTELPYHKTGIVTGVDISKDLKTILDTLKHKSNFFFIEKTIPSHIMYITSKSKGVEGERIAYIERLKHTNNWLKSLVQDINEFDNQALIIIVADHGGFVGMKSREEALTKKINEVEASSSFSSLLSIRWPKNSAKNHYSDEIKSSVNLFRKVFFTLSANHALIDNLNDNSSYLPLKKNKNSAYYKYIDDYGHFVFEKVLKK